MKIAPVSGDLLVKLAVGALAVGALIYAARKANDYGQAAADRILQLARDAADKVNPASPNNLVYSGLTSAITAATGQQDSPGTFWREATSNDSARVQAMLDGQPIPEQQTFWSQFNDAALLAQ